MAVRVAGGLRRWYEAGMIPGGRAWCCVLLVVAAAVPISACGDDPPNGSSGSGGTSAGAATSGSSSAGGSKSGEGHAGGSGASSNGGGGSPGSSGTAGTAVGGSAGSAGVGGSATAGHHCDGGKVLKFPDEVFVDFGGPMSNCDGYMPSADGITTAPVLDVLSIDLPSPLTPGTPFGFSVLVTAAAADGSNTIEFWGASEACGSAKEKLYEGVMKKGILCVELKAKTSHTVLLMAEKGAGSRGTTDIAFCPGGSCAP